MLTGSDSAGSSRLSGASVSVTIQDGLFKSPQPGTSSYQTVLEQSLKEEEAETLREINPSITEKGEGHRRTGGSDSSPKIFPMYLSVCSLG